MSGELIDTNLENQSGPELPPEFAGLVDALRRSQFQKTIGDDFKRDEKSIGRSDRKVEEKIVHVAFGTKRSAVKKYLAYIWELSRDCLPEELRTTQNADSGSFEDAVQRRYDDERIMPLKLRESGRSANKKSNSRVAGSKSQPVPTGDSNRSRDLLTGRPEEVMIQTLLRVREFEGRWDLLREFLSGTLANTLEALEKQPGATPERRVDIVLAAVVEFRPHADSAEFRRFVGALARHLRRQEESKRAPEFFQTWAALGDLVVEVPGQANLVLGSMFYQMVVGHYATLCRNRQRSGDHTPLNNKELSRIHVASHNLASVMGRLKEASDPSALQIEAEPYRELAMLMAIAGGKASTSAAESLRKLVRTQLSDFEVAYMHRVANAPSVYGEKLGLSHMQLAYIEAISAASRATDEDNKEHVPAAYFNAGISLIRVRDEVSGNRRTEIALARVVVNGLGLLCSLSLSNDVSEILQKHDGLDCTVNFLGAATEVTWTDDIKRSLAVVIQNILDQREVLPEENFVDFFRIERSLSELSLPLEDASEVPELTMIRSDLLRVIGDALRQLGGALDWDDKQLCESHIKAAKAAFDLIKSEIDWDQLQSKIQTVQPEAAKDKSSEEILMTYFPERFCGPYDLSEAGLSPLVECGMVSLTVWNQITHAALDGDQESLGEYLREEGNLSWLD